MKTRTPLLVTLSTLVLMSGGGCVENLEPGDARTAWRATEAILLGAEPRARAADDSRKVEYEEDCPDGGTLSLDGTHQDFETKGRLDIVYTANFKNCRTDGLGIDGTMTFSVLARATAELFERTVLRFNGELDYDDRAEGLCDVALKASSSESYSLGNFRESLRYDGIVCGHDASALLGDGT